MWWHKLIAVGVLFAAVLISELRKDAVYTFAFVHFHTADGDERTAARNGIHLSVLSPRAPSPPSELRRRLCGPAWAAPAGDAVAALAGASVAFLFCGEFADWLRNPQYVLEEAFGRRVKGLSYATFVDRHGCRSPQALFARTVGQWLDSSARRDAWPATVQVWLGRSDVGVIQQAPPPQAAVAWANELGEKHCQSWDWPPLIGLGTFLAGSVRETNLGWTFFSLYGDNLTQSQDIASGSAAGSVSMSLTPLAL